MKISKKLKSCRICKKKDLVPYLDLGNQPPSNSFISKKNIKEKKFSLKVVLCKKCGLSQLDTVVSHKFIFSDYVYLSSSSKALVNHYQRLVDHLIKKFKPKPHDLIYDIGCNDGVMLDRYGKKFKNLRGFEPSSAGKYAAKKGHQIKKKFFSKIEAVKVKETEGKAKLITVTNVFAHVDNIRDFTSGISEMLDINGVFIIEFPYLLDMIKDLYFDTIYHEHLSYLCVHPLINLFKDFNLRIFDINKVNLGASGPALRVYVCKEKAKFKQTSATKHFLNTEKKIGIKNIKTYRNFASRVFKLKNDLNKILNDKIKKGNKIGAFGAPAKGNTLLNFLQLDSTKILAVAENNKLKINKYTPGSKIKIVSDEKFNKLNCKYALLLSWNYLNFFKKNSIFYKRGGKFIIPFPKPRII